MRGVGAEHVRDPVHQRFVFGRRGDGPRAATADGYDIVNTNDSLFSIAPFATYYHPHGLDGRYL